MATIHQAGEIELINKFVVDNLDAWAGETDWHVVKIGKDSAPKNKQIKLMKLPVSSEYTTFNNDEGKWNSVLSLRIYKNKEDSDDLYAISDRITAAFLIEDLEPSDPTQEFYLRFYDLGLEGSTGRVSSLSYIELNLAYERWEEDLRDYSNLYV